MSNFCQECSDLINQLENLRAESKDTLLKSESSQNTANIKTILDKLKPTHESLKTLLESTTTLTDGRKIRQIELMGLEIIAQEMGASYKADDPNPLEFEVFNNSIVNFSLEKIEVRTRMTNLRPIQLFKDIVELNIEKADIQDLSPLSLLTKLDELNLSTTNIKDITPLSKLTRLKNITLWRTGIKDISALKKLTELERVAISQTQVIDINALKNLTKLKILFIDNTKIEDLNPVSQLTNMTDIVFNSTKVKDISALSQLKKLIRIELDQTKVSDLQPLVKLKQDSGVLNTVFIRKCPNLQGSRQKFCIQVLEANGVKVYV